MQAVHDSMHVAHTHIRARVQRKIYCVLLNNALPLSQHYAILGEGKACISCTLIRSKKTDRQFIFFSFFKLYISLHTLPEGTFPRDPPISWYRVGAVYALVALLLTSAGVDFASTDFMRLPPLVRHEGFGCL